MSSLMLLGAGPSDPAATEPAAPRMDHIPIYGQSLAQGVTTAAAATITVGASATHKMPNGGIRAHYDTPSLANENYPIDGDQLASLVALEEETNPNGGNMGETVASGIGNWLTNKTLFTATGRNAYNIALLSRAPGGISDAYHFSNTIAAVRFGSEAAAAAGDEYAVPCMVWMQGEADGGLSTSKASYKSQLLQLIDDFRTHISIAGQIDASDMKLVVYQQAYYQVGKTYGDIAVAMAELFRSDPDKVVLLGPSYYEEYGTVADLHQTANGYRNRGERFGLCISELDTWQPTIITGVSRSGTNIDVTIALRTAPLTLDTTLVTTIADSGFAYSGASITGVSITDDGTGDGEAVIRITIDADAGGTLTYAKDNGTTVNIGPTTGSRGNVRDSSPEVTDNDSRKLYNWLCVDEWSVA